MTPYLLADDLSGALELGGVFRARGWRVALDLSEAGRSESADELKLVSTETRNATEAEAATVVQRVITEEARRGGRLLFKKIDSTLRGPIAAEVRVVMTELQPDLIVLCTANPGAGRTVVNGVVRVNGVSLEETDFRKDPIWPATTGCISEVLRTRGIDGCVRWSLDEIRRGMAPVIRLSSADEAGAETPIVIADAETDQDLAAVAQALCFRSPRTIFVGASAFASALAKTWPAPNAPPLDVPRLRHGMLVLCGSRHPASARQLDYLAREDAVPVFTARLDQTRTAELARVVQPALAKGVAAIRFAAAADGRDCDPRRLIEFIGAVASAVIATSGVSGLYLTGGETAAAVCRRCGGDRLEVAGELEPGVVKSVLRRRSAGSLLVVTKPGGYGAPDSIHNALRRVMK